MNFWKGSYLGNEFAPDLLYAPAVCHAGHGAAHGTVHRVTVDKRLDLQTTTAAATTALNKHKCGRALP
jgi:hypothetical protein